MTEHWKPIPGYEGHYEVSDRGRVRSIERTIIRKNGIPQRIAGRVLRPATGTKGHQHVELWRDNQAMSRYVHHLVLEAFTGPQPEGMECCHNNGNPADNTVENLRWDTASSNGYDRVRHGTHPASKKTHCKRGHEFIDANLVPSTARKGFRNCLACSRAQSYAKNHPEWKPRLQELSDTYFQALAA